MKATTIDEVIEQLNLIIEECRHTNSSMGLFAILYRNVTIRIKECIHKKDFEDNPRMEKLDVLFANRYIDAYREYKNKSACTQSWRIAFAAAEKNESLITQQLLLGINAHINLDLGIIAAQTVKGGKIQDLQNDFKKVNSILAEMVDEVQSKINKASPLFGILDPLTKRLDEKLANFTIEKARDGAWEFAYSLFIADEENQAQMIKDRDFTIARLAENLANPTSSWMKTVINFIRLFEEKEPRKIMEVLD